MRLVRSFLKLFFLHILLSLFQIAGLVRVVRRGRRAFRKALEKEGLPKEVVDVLAEGFFVEINWKGLIFGKEKGLSKVFSEHQHVRLVRLVPQAQPEPLETG